MSFFPDHQQSLDVLHRKTAERRNIPADPQNLNASSPRVTRPRVFAFIAALLLPLAVMGYGLFLLLNHALVTLPFLIAFLLLPAGSILLLKKLIFSSAAAFVKTLAALLLLVVFAAAFLISALAGNFERLERFSGDSAPAAYNETAAFYPSLPNLSELGTPQRTEYYRYTGSQFIFTRNADVLICRYSESDYSAEKASLDSRYSFQTEPMSAGDIECLPQAEIGGYFFRALSVGDEYADEIDYPKQLILIGTNDSAKEIAYIAFRDPDIDYIDGLHKFISDNCGWRHVR